MMFVSHPMEWYNTACRSTHSRSSGQIHYHESNQTIRSCPSSPSLRILSLAILLLTTCLGRCSPATVRTTDTPEKAITTSWDLSIPAQNWARAAAANEIVALRHHGSYLRYRMHVMDDKGDRVREVVETKDGSVARLISRDGKPLTAVEDQAERQRLKAMLESPQNFARHIRNEESGKKYAEEIIRLMPEAMLYTYTPGQPKSGNGRPGAEVVLDFQPDPTFRPPDTASQALLGLRGRLWIDPVSRNLLRIEVEIFRSENFGWGMIAHVNPGGKVVLVQTSVGPGRWIFSHFSDQISMRVGLIKPVNVKDTIEASDFQTIDTPVSYQEAIRSLLALPAAAK